MSADDQQQTAAVASPCVRVCLYDRELDACRACLRTLDEIAHWSIYTCEEQRAVLTRIEAVRAVAGGTGAD